MAKATCQKCGSDNARYIRDQDSLYVNCSCGYLKCVYSTLQDMSIEHNTPADQAKLPKQGSHLFNTLVMLSAIAPANSREITDTLILHGHDFTVSDVSSYLMMLREKGLVEVVAYRRGVPGGSTWQLSSVAANLLK